MATVTLGHAAVAALLGLAASGLVLSGAIGDAGLARSIRDPTLLVTLSLSTAMLLATGSGISAFILCSIERADKAAATRRGRA